MTWDRTSTQSFRVRISRSWNLGTSFPLRQPLEKISVVTIASTKDRCMRMILGWRPEGSSLRVQARLDPPTSSRYDSTPTRMSDVTHLLMAASAGDRQAAAEILPLVYDELRKLAAARMAREATGHSLAATALTHEAYLRLV